MHYHEFDELMVRFFFNLLRISHVYRTCYQQIHPSPPPFPLLPDNPALFHPTCIIYFIVTETTQCCQYIAGWRPSTNTWAAYQGPYIWRKLMFSLWQQPSQILKNLSWFKIENNFWQWTFSLNSFMVGISYFSFFNEAEAKK